MRVRRDLRAGFWRHLWGRGVGEVLVEGGWFGQRTFVDVRGEEGIGNVADFQRQELRAASPAQLVKLLRRSTVINYPSLNSRYQFKHPSLYRMVS